MNGNPMTQPRVAARKDIHDAPRALATPTRPAALAPDSGVALKDLLEIGFAVLRIVELAILFA